MLKGWNLLISWSSFCGVSLSERCCAQSYRVVNCVQIFLLFTRQCTSTNLSWWFLSLTSQWLGILFLNTEGGWKMLELLNVCLLYQFQNGLFFWFPWWQLTLLQGIVPVSIWTEFSGVIFHTKNVLYNFLKKIKKEEKRQSLA